MTQREILPTIAGLALLIAIAIPVCKPSPDSKFQKLYREAESIATRKLGDMKAPLTYEEKAEWYGLMGVKEDEKPSMGQLRGFIKEYK